MHSYLLIDIYETLENNRIPIPLYKGKKIRKIRKPSGLSLNPLFKKECHLLSDKLESMEI